MPGLPLAREIQKIIKNQNALVFIASALENIGSLTCFFSFLEESFIGPPSGERPISSGLRCKRKKLGKNPIINTVAPIMIHPIRHPSKLIAAYAIKGIAVSPTICTRVAIETAWGLRRTNQLLIALYIPRSNGPAKFMRAIQNNK